jgi:hypothetical protein
VTRPICGSSGESSLLWWPVSKDPEEFQFSPLSNMIITRYAPHKVDGRVNDDSPEDRFRFAVQKLENLIFWDRQYLGQY